MNLRRMVPVCGFMLGILLVMKLMPTERVGPVQVGVDAVTAASRSGGGSAWKGYTRKSNKSTTPAAKEEGTGEGQAQFVTWQKGTDRGKPALYLDVVPRVGLGYASLVVPNKNVADETINPPAEVSAMAPRLRIGDVVRVSFSRPGGKLVVNALDIVKASDQDANSKLFTYGGVRTTKVDAQDRAAVCLRRKNLSWLFLVPGSGGANTVPVAGTTGPKPPPLNQEWAESLL